MICNISKWIHRLITLCGPVWFSQYNLDADYQMDKSTLLGECLMANAKQNLMDAGQNNLPNEANATNSNSNSKNVHDNQNQNPKRHKHDNLTKDGDNVNVSSSSNKSENSPTATVSENVLYLLGKAQGEGTYGTVRHGTCAKTNTPVVVKTIDEIFDNLEFAKRFLREIKILRMMQGHERIVSLRDIVLLPQGTTRRNSQNYSCLGKTPSSASLSSSSSSSSSQTSPSIQSNHDGRGIAIGCTNGSGGVHSSLLPSMPVDFDCASLILSPMDQDLLKTCREGYYLTLGHVKWFMFQLIQGVHALHKFHIVHRDLKLGNVLINLKTLELKICDFGLSTCLEMPNHLYEHVQIERAKWSAWRKPLEQQLKHNIKQMIGQNHKSSSPSSSSSNNPKRNHKTGNVPMDVDSHDWLLKLQLTSYVQTRWYRAPELICENNIYGCEIDLWSCGVLFAEMLRMMRESEIDVKQRNCMFPGTTCFPISCKTMKDYENPHDQMNLILHVLGVPESTNWIQHSGNQEFFRNRYMRRFPRPRPKTLKTRFFWADADALDLMQRLLEIDPRKRITAFQALNHPFLAEHSKNSSQTTSANSSESSLSLSLLSKKEETEASNPSQCQSEQSVKLSDPDRPALTPLTYSKSQISFFAFEQEMNYWEEKLASGLIEEEFLLKHVKTLVQHLVQQEIESEYR